MQRKPSASNAEAFVRCTTSHVLTQHESYQEHTERGTSGHDILCGVINGRPLAKAQMAKTYPTLGLELQRVFGGCVELKGETAYVVDVQKRTSTYLGQEIGRDYEGKLGRPLADYELGVSLDVQGRKRGRHLLRDFKFGRHASWWQLYVQAMAILWLPGQTDILEADAGFVHIISRDDEDEDGNEKEALFVEEDSATLYISDLDDRADEIMTAFGRARSLEAQLAAGVPPTELKTVEGSWCKYCGAFPHCPSKWKLARAMLDLDVVGHVQTMTLEQCGAAWKKLGEIEKKMIKPMRDVLRKRNEHEGPFPLDNGKVLRMVEMPPRDSLDKPAVVALLRSLLAEKYEKEGYTPEQIAEQIGQQIGALFKEGAPYYQMREVKR